MDIYTDLLRRFENRFETDDQEESEPLRRSKSISGGDGTMLRTEEPGASFAELSAWDMRRLECMRQLGQWKVTLFLLSRRFPWKIYGSSFFEKHCTEVLHKQRGRLKAQITWCVWVIRTVLTMLPYPSQRLNMTASRC